MPFSPLPEAKRTLVGRAEHGELVPVRGRRWGDVGLLLKSRRHGGEWEEIGNLARREVRDTRSLLGDGHREAREYRGRCWDGGGKISGEWYEVVKVTVAG